jgi:hypothetical protein
MIASDNDTSDIFFAGINYTGEQLSLSLAITFFPGVIDTGHQ